MKDEKVVMKHGGREEGGKEEREGREGGGRIRFLPAEKREYNCPP